MLAWRDISEVGHVISTNGQEYSKVKPYNRVYLDEEVPIGSARTAHLAK